MSASAPLLWSVKPGLILIGATLSSLCLICFARQVKKAILFSVVISLGFRLVPSVGNEPNLSASQVEQLDVGQGDSALVLDTRGHFGLIDSGSAKRMSLADWLRIFSERQVSRLDWVFLTHLDEDHAGGLKLISSLIPVGCVSTAQQQLSEERGVRLKNILTARSVSVTDLSAACVPFPTLPPPLHPATAQKQNSNMSAIWIPLQNGGSYVSSGDADRDDEERISLWIEQNNEGRLGTHFVKLDHHGSKTSSSLFFLRHTHADVAWISVGLGNSYGHPSKEVLARVQELGIPIHRTDLEGSLGTTEEDGRHRRRTRPP